MLQCWRFGKDALRPRRCLGADRAKETDSSRYRDAQLKAGGVPDARVPVIYELRTGECPHQDGYYMRAPRRSAAFAATCLARLANQADSLSLSRGSSAAGAEPSKGLIGAGALEIGVAVGLFMFIPILAIS